MLASERVLGPRWSQKELRTFYILLKAYGKQWERLEERLPSRTHAMVRALYDMHRGYLSLPEASVEGFCTIMTDHYKSLDELHQEQQGSATATDMGPPARAAASPTPIPPPLTLPPLSKVVAVEMTPTAPLTRPRDDTPPSSSDTRAKKKRKLERLLAREESPRTESATQRNVLQQEVAGSSASSNQQATPFRVRARKPVRTTAAKRRGNWLRDTDRFPEKKYDLPWCYWFYSFVDVDFFNHNEFIECLQRMQLGNLVKAARPIWASVRASMGHPRRLSPRFLAEEKQKLEHYREVKRRPDSTPQSNRWPYKTPIALASGLRVLAQLSNPRRFVSGTIENFSARDGVCKVRLDNNGSRVCLLDSIMVLTGEQHSGSDLSSLSGATMADGQPITKLSSRMLLEQAYQDKLASVALVRDLLKRKELLVNAMSKMNVQARILRNNFFTSNTYIASNTSTSDDSLFQRQYAWLVVNLDVTNRYLRAALLRLQDVARVPKLSNSGSTRLGVCDSSLISTRSQPSILLDHHQEDRPATLTLEHMRWAINFLTLSAKKTSDLVKMMTDAGEDSSTTVDERGSGDEDNSSKPSPQTKELVANCLSLANIVRRGSSANIPPLITQKLMERMFELLSPRFESNMDLYAELRSAAEGVSIMQRQAHLQGLSLD